jgi:hypothetical protein
VEFFQDDQTQADGYLDATPIMEAAGNFRSTIAPTSPLAARASRRSPSRKDKGKGRATRMLPSRRSQEEAEAEAAAIIESVRSDCLVPCVFLHIPGPRRVGCPSSQKTSNSSQS